MGQIIMWQWNAPILLNADIFSYLLSSHHLLTELIKLDYRVWIFEELGILLMLDLYLIQGHNEFTCGDRGSLIWTLRCIVLCVVGLHSMVLVHATAITPPQ